MQDRGRRGSIPRHNSCLAPQHAPGARPEAGGTPVLAPESAPGIDQSKENMLRYGNMKPMLLFRRGIRLTLLAGLVIGTLGGLRAAPAPAAPAAAAPLRLVLDQFADPAFFNVWERTDALVAQGAVSRTWLWGPTAGPEKREPWTDSPGGTRLVQYFDKGRMEITNPSAPPTDPFFVTNGLLAVELIGGQAQTGPATYTPGTPANIPISGDRDDPTAPTYASFRPVSNLPGADHRAPDATGQAVNQAITRDGTVGSLPAPRQDYGVRVAYYDPTTGHNVPDVFWTFLNSPGTVLVGGQVVPRRLFDPWFSLTGLPISEAYWSYVRIAGVNTEVLIQPFERRVLTYAPNNPDGFKVEMGNIGLHYLEWRYGIGAPGTPAPTPIPRPPPVPPDVRIQSIANARPGLDLNYQNVVLVNASGAPVDLINWRLVAPKNDHDDVYFFPRFVLGAGETVTVYAGWGADNPRQLYMKRLTWFFDGTPFEGVILFDSISREVTRFFLSGGAPPTPLPGNTTPPPGPPPATTPTFTPLPTQAAGRATPTVTATLPAPQGTGTPSLTPGTATATVTPGGSVTATATPSVLPTGTPTPRVASDGTALIAWIDEPSPRQGTAVTLLMQITRNGQPLGGAEFSAVWHFPSGDQICTAQSGNDGYGFCNDRLLPNGTAGQTIWIDVLAKYQGISYATYTGVRPLP